MGYNADKVIYLATDDDNSGAFIGTLKRKLYQETPGLVVMHQRLISKEL